MSVLVQQKGSGAKAIAQGPCYDGIPRAPLPFYVHHRARARGMASAPGREDLGTLEAPGLSDD